MSTVILLIHHDTLARAFIGYVLEQQGYVVLAAGYGEEALVLLNQEQPPLLPDAVVVGNDDLRELLTSSWRRQVPDAQRLPLLVLGEVGAGNLPARVVTVVPPEPRLLLLKLKSLLRNNATLRDEALERQGLRLDPSSQEALAGHLRLNLTPLSFRLLYFLMKNPGRVYSREQLLDQVWKDQGFVEERTVDVHVYRLRNQLERYGYGHVIEAVRGSGYRFVADAPRPENRPGAGLRFAS